MTTATAEAPPLDGMDLHYGLRVVQVGEEGDLLIAGHHPLMQVVAALNSFARHHIGLMNLADDRSCTLADIAPDIEQRWATKQTHADCDDPECRTRSGAGTYWCEMCRTLNDGNWWIDVHNDQRPGSFPVTWMST